MAVNDAHTFEVGELNRIIGRLIEDPFFEDVWVQGEMAKPSRSNVGHAYFQLIASPLDESGCCAAGLEYDGEQADVQAPVCPGRGRGNHRIRRSSIRSRKCR